MSDLLPIIFARGANQSIDPRVAPPDVHAVAQNVRWRKDGRPQKRYGLSSISSVGLDTGGSTYTQHGVNFIGSWRGAPLLGLGAGVRRLVSSTTWSDNLEANQNQIPHFAPGRRDAVARTDLSPLANGSVAYANKYLLYCWDDGTSIYYQVITPSGSVLFANKLLSTGTYPRAVAVGNLIYILCNNAGQLQCSTFDTTSATITNTINIGSGLLSSTSYFDVCSRGTDWLLVYQNAATNLAVKIMSGATSPVSTASASITTTAAPGNCRLAIAGTATSVVFVGWLEAALGKIRFQVFSNALVFAAGPTTIETDVNNVDQPTIVLDDINNAGLFWGGSSSQQAYMRYTDIANSGSAGVTTTVPHVRPCSKAFYGNSDAFALDGRFIWAHTDNAFGTGGVPDPWADQRTFYLMWLNINNSHPKFAMWTPNMTGSTLGSNQHMSEVVTDGTGSNNTTYWTVMNQAVRSGALSNDCIGIDSVSFTSIFARQREAARDTVTAGRATQISGGMLYEFNGSVEETGWMHAPVIISATATVGGSLTASSNYLYIAVYEWLDAQGRRHRSAPSDPVALVTTGTNKTGTLSVTTLSAYSRRSPPALHIYRTLAGGTTYHRVTPNTGAPNAAGTGFVQAYVDAMLDSTAATAEILYTDGGVLPNDLPPPCTFMTLCAGRLWLGGQLDRNVITASKLLVDGEPTQFSSFDAFNVFLPEDCTGIGSIDATVVGFAREAIYLINGDGPDDQGNGQFNSPQKLPTDVGCIDWRSVVETSIGIFFQSKRGIYLLPRGFNTPVFVGQDVEDTTTAYPVCKSAVVVSVPASSGQLGEITVRFVMADTEAGTNTVCLVYDLRAQGWSVDVSPDVVALGPGGTWNEGGGIGDVYIQSKGASTYDSLWREVNFSYSDHGLFVPTTLGTGDIRPFGIAGYGHFRKVLLLGEYRGDAIVNVSVSVDSQTADVFPFTVVSADGPDGTVYLDVTPRIQKGSSIRVTVADATNGTATEGFIAQAIFIETDLIGKTERLASGRKL